MFTKNEKYIAGYFASLFSHFVPLVLLFAFPSFSHQSWHLCEKSKDFIVYFFTALIKHEICMKYERCVVDCFVFCGLFCENTRKIPVKCEYEKCIAGFKLFIIRKHTFQILSFIFPNNCHKNCNLVKDVYVFITCIQQSSTKI